MHTPDGSTIAEVLSWRAARQPDRCAYMFLARGEQETARLTYSELEFQALRIATLLRTQHAEGRPVLLAYPSGLDFIAAFFGCLYAGAIAVPVPVFAGRRAFERTRAIEADAKPAAILTLRALLAHAASGEANEETGEHSTTPWFATDELQSIDPAAPSRLDANSVAVLQYTSGSTGSPRGVVLTHANLMHNQRALARAVETVPEDRCVSWLPLYHDMGLIGGILQPLYWGGLCALLPPLSFLQQPLRWLRAITHYRATISPAPCFAYDLCARRADSESVAQLDLSTWRAAICGGETIRPGAIEKFFKVFGKAGFRPSTFFPAYGLAESTLLATSLDAGRGLITRQADERASSNSGQDALQAGTRRRLACCGKPWEGQEIAIVDPDSRRQLPEGECGEIWLRGPSVAQGYWFRPEETAQVFSATLAGDPDGRFWLRTGDLGLIGTEGLYLTGRRKDIIVIRGTNYDPLDIELCASECDPSLPPGGAAAFSVDPDEGEVVVIMLEIERSCVKELDAPRLAGKIANAINREFGLSLYDVVFLRSGTLPRTTSGKIQRHVSREKYLLGQLSIVASHDSPALGRCRPHARENA